MKFKNYSLGFVAGALALCSCHEGEKRLAEERYADFGHVAAEYIEGKRDFTTVKTSVAEHQREFWSLLSIAGIEADGDEAVEAWIESPAVKGFAQAVDSLSPSGKEISEALAYAIERAEHDGLTIPIKSFATAIWGKPQSIIFADSTMFVALNHYLGSDHAAYMGLPDYRRASKRPEMAAYDAAEAMVATSYPYEPGDEAAVINRLVYEGALTAAKMRMVKNASLAPALGYSDEQLEWLEKNEREIWRKMLGLNMVFDRSETVADRLTQPAPATTLLSPDCPGRAGRYIGYRIVESYLRSHPDAGLKDVLSKEYYGMENPLSVSNYRP